MSIWREIQDRSAGITKRKEDEIEIPIDDQLWVCGVANSIADLPQNAQQGRIYVIEDTGQIVIFKNNMWTSIGESIYSR